MMKSETRDRELLHMLTLFWTKTSPDNLSWYLHKKKMFETQKSSVKEMHNRVNETNIGIYDVKESLTQK